MLGVSRRSGSFAGVFAFGVAASGLLLGCGSSTTTNGASADAGASDDAQAAPPTGNDGSAVDANVDGNGTSNDSGPSTPDSGEADAAPRNAACTPLSAQTGTIVNTTHGRLDGTLVYVVPLGGPGKCNGDDSHVHLQIEVSGLVYDVAVDIGAAGDEVGMLQDSIAVPGGAWAEGWHGTDALTYSTLGVKSSALTPAAPATIAAQVEALLQSTSKISVFCVGYTPGDNGCHDVHYENGNGEDGAIVLDPTSATSPILFFRFQGQSF